MFLNSFSALKGLSDPHTIKSSWATSHVKMDTVPAFNIKG
jgi:hypothetical protein